MMAPLILLDPAAPRPEEQDVVVVLNDFTTRDPAAILAGLQGRMGAASTRRPGMRPMPRREMLGGMTMAGPDLNDVKYDAFLANRLALSDPEIVRVLPGRTVRLRIIDAASASNFFVRTGRLRAKALAVDGEDIVPFSERVFELALAQRIDLRLAIPRGEGAYPILAQGEGTDMLAGIVLATPGAEVPTPCSSCPVRPSPCSSTPPTPATG
jgi:FtsP/CotA-like multicopper oxidase with cupredoxin domain